MTSSPLSLSWDIGITSLFSAEAGGLATLPEDKPSPSTYICELLSLKPMDVLNTERSEDWLITSADDLNKFIFMWAQTH